MKNLTLATRPTLQQEMAFAILRKTTFIVDADNIRKAASVMGKTLSTEVETFISTAHGCAYSACGPQMLDILEKLGAEILAA